MGLQQQIPPSAEPISLTEAAAHCRISGTVDYPVLQGLIVAARQYVENWTGRQLVTASWLYTQDSFYAQDLTARRPPATPYGNYPTAGFWPRLTGYVYGVPANSAIRLPKSPTQAITNFGYTDGLGNPQTLTSSQYTLTAYREPAVVIPVYGTTWPVTQIGLDAVQITYQCGWPHTTSTAGISAGANQVVTPASMAGIGGINGTVLQVDSGSVQEFVKVTATTGTTFTATFAQSHLAGCIITAVPQAVREAILLIVSHWYEHRESVTDGPMAKVPMAAESLLYSVWPGEYVPGAT